MDDLQNICATHSVGFSLPYNRMEKEEPHP